MRKAITIHIVAFLMASYPLPIWALDYDVDWPTSGNGKHVLAITVNGCETRFNVDDKDFETFGKKIDDDRSGVSYELVKKAINRARNGCKN